MARRRFHFHRRMMFLLCLSCLVLFLVFALPSGLYLSMNWEDDISSSAVKFKSKSRLAAHLPKPKNDNALPQRSLAVTSKLHSSLHSQVRSPLALVFSPIYSLNLLQVHQRKMVYSRARHEAERAGKDGKKGTLDQERKGKKRNRYPS